MKNERQKLSGNRLTPIDLYKLTPRINCKECGLQTCLAFATQVIVGQVDLDSCPYLDQQAIKPVRAQLAAQHKSGIGVKREGFEKALEYLRDQVKQTNLRAIAPSVGAIFGEEDGRHALQMTYFGETIFVTDQEIRSTSGEEIDPWEKILLHNYIIGGASEPSGVWIGMESLPNSVSKIKSLKAHCEDRLAQAYAGKMKKLPHAIAGLGRNITADIEQVDFAAEFPILPKLAIRVLWWDEDVDEGFASNVKFLFDSRVLSTLDLESLLFACEQLTDRLMPRSAPRLQD